MMTSSSSAAAASSSSMLSVASNSPCAACKFLRRKCQPDCVFAPYFPPDQPNKFAYVHKVFGASNVTKLLNDLRPYQREDAVNSLAYEAEMRHKDPVYGCVGIISILQHQVRHLQMALTCAQSELSKYQTSTTANAPLVGVSNGVVGHGLGSHSIGIGEIGFGREQFFATPPRDQYHLMMRNYDPEMAARLGANGAYDAGFMAAVNVSAASFGHLGGQFPRPRTAGGDERQAIGPP